MAFNAQETLRSMADAAGGVLSGEWPKVQACVEKALKEQEQALEEIAVARLRNDLTEDEMQSQLEDEKKTLEAALLACQVGAKAIAQRAVNAAFQVLEQAIKAAL